WMGRSPPNIVGSISPTTRSSILRSPLAVRIIVPFRKQLLEQRFPTGVSFPQFAEAGSVFDTLPTAANARIAPTFIVLRRVRCIPEFEFRTSLVIVRSRGEGSPSTVYSFAQRVTMNFTRFDNNIHAPRLPRAR